jgi:hypothetical protein
MSFNADGDIRFFAREGPFSHTASACNVLFATATVQTLFLKPNHKVSFGVTGAANFIDPTSVVTCS